MANNRYLESYDETKPENYLLYLDANNLYGFAMVQPLPYSNIKFDAVSIDDVLNTSDDNDVGYIVECDLIFPEEIHDLVKEFPPCPENTSPKLEWLSEFQIKVLNKTTKIIRMLK